jgi:hypothetical protein
MAILVLVCIAVLVIGITALVTIPVRHAEAVLNDLYWKWSMEVGIPRWDKRTSPTKPRGEVQNVVNLNAADRQGKPLWSYDQRVWERVRVIHADGHDQNYPHWPDDKIREGEDTKSKKQLYRATFQATGARRHSKRLSRRRWERLRKGNRYQLGLNAFGGVRTVKPPPFPRARPTTAGRQAPATAPPPAGGDGKTIGPTADASDSEPGQQF